jgi:hypothetical protein
VLTLLYDIISVVTKWVLLSLGIGRWIRIDIFRSIFKINFIKILQYNFLFEYKYLGFRQVLIIMGHMYV